MQIKFSLKENTTKENQTKQNETQLKSMENWKYWGKNKRSLSWFRVDALTQAKSSYILWITTDQFCKTIMAYRIFFVFYSIYLKSTITINLTCKNKI